MGGYLRYLGVTYRKAARLFKDVFDLDLTHPSCMAFNTEQSQNGAPLYEAIKQSIRYSPYVNADETGWRVNGDNHWLWIFTNKDAALYHIDESSGGKVATNILGEKYQGVLGCDFYSAYNELVAGVKDWAIPKMTDLLSSPVEHEDTQRLRNRIIRHNQELFIFLDDPSVEPTNNRAERQLRPMVIMRKLTFGNRSDFGALNQAVLMSIVETGVLNEVEPLDIFLAHV